jgi:hypothetical protein
MDLGLLLLLCDLLEVRNLTAKIIQLKPESTTLSLLHCNLYKSCMLHLYLIIVDQSNALRPVIWSYKQCSGITQDKGLSY